MKLCLSCHRVTRGPDPVFCTSCGRSFNAKVCAKSHGNAPDASFCSTCASPMLSEPTRCLDLGCLPTGLTIAVSVLIWRWAVAHICLVAHSAWLTATNMAGYLVDSCGGCVRAVFSSLVHWLLLAWLAGLGLLLVRGGGGKVGSYLRSLPTRALWLLGKCLKPIARLLVVAALRLLFPARAKRGAGASTKKE